MRLSFGRRAASLARHALAQHGIRLTPRAVASGALVVGAPVAFGLRFLCGPPALAEASSAEATELPASSKWNRTISAVLPAVVSIKVNRVRAFDTVGSGSVQATGFVVDKERGLILTNRHVAGPGPVVAEAIFVNNEEVPLQAVYYDPVPPRPPPRRAHARARAPPTCGPRPARGRLSRLPSAPPRHSARTSIGRPTARLAPAGNLGWQAG